MGGEIESLPAAAAAARHQPINAQDSASGNPTASTLMEPATPATTRVRKLVDDPQNPVQLFDKIVAMLQPVIEKATTTTQKSMTLQLGPLKDLHLLTKQMKRTLTSNNAVYEMMTAQSSAIAQLKGNVEMLIDELKENTAFVQQVREEVKKSNQRPTYSAAAGRAPAARSAPPAPTQPSRECEVIIQQVNPTNAVDLTERFPVIVDRIRAAMSDNPALTLVRVRAINRL